MPWPFFMRKINYEARKIYDASLRSSDYEYEESEKRFWKVTKIDSKKGYDDESQK